MTPSGTTEATGVDEHDFREARRPAVRTVRVDVDSITMDTSFEDLGADSLDIVEIPTNRPVVRIDNEDAVYKTEQGKYRA